MKDEKYFEGMNKDDFPEVLMQLLKEASLLYHVPYSYLNPDSNLIQKEDLRFFQIDHNWVMAYLDGICSPGRNAAIDYTHDTYMLIEQYETALCEQQTVRQELRNTAIERNAFQSVEPCSGFLLYSELVEDFRGLEFQAYSDTAGKKELPVLRIEKLGTCMMIGIFRGILKRLDIGQPPEGLHYGFICEKDRTLKKTMRNIDDGVLNGNQITIPLKDTADRIIDVKQTAVAMKESLHHDITATEFALEMIQNAHTGVFLVDDI